MDLRTPSNVVKKTRQLVAIGGLPAKSTETNIVKKSRSIKALAWHTYSIAINSREMLANIRWACKSKRLLGLRIMTPSSTFLWPRHQPHARYHNINKRSPQLPPNKTQTDSWTSDWMRSLKELMNLQLDDFPLALHKSTNWIRSKR